MNNFWYFPSKDLFLIWGDRIRGEGRELEKKGLEARDFLTDHIQPLPFSSVFSFLHPNTHESPHIRLVPSPRKTFNKNMGLDLVGEFNVSNHIKKCRLVIVGHATNEVIN